MYHITNFGPDCVLGQSDAGMVLRSITKKSPRLGLVLSCKVAREALRFVPEGDARPLQAIEAAERLVRGEATVEECKSAADEANVAADAYAAAAAAAVDVAANACGDGAYATFAAVDTAYAAAYAAAAGYTNAWRIARDAEHRRLCGVIAEALREAGL